MTSSRISPDALRSQTNRAKEDIEKQKSDAAEELRALKRALTVFGKQSLLQACEGHTLLKLPENPPKDLAKSVKKLGFNVISASNAREQLEELKSNNKKYKETIRRVLNESELIQAFISKAPTDSPVDDNFTKLFNLLEKAERYRQESGEENTRDYLVKYLESARHWIKGKGNLPSKSIYEHLEVVWINFVWHQKSNLELVKHRRLMGQLTGDGTFASWHSILPETAFGKNQAPSPNFLRWLSAADGQKLLDAIDARMAAKSSVGSNSLKIEILESDGEYFWKPDMASFYAIPLGSLASLMKMRGFSVNSVDEYTIEISW